MNKNKAEKWQERQEKNKQLRICCICKQTIKKHLWLDTASRCRDCQSK